MSALNHFLRVSDETHEVKPGSHLERDRAYVLQRAKTAKYCKIDDRHEVQAGAAEKQ